MKCWAENCLKRLKKSLQNKQKGGLKPPFLLKIMSRLREINEKMNAYMSNLEGNIDQAVLSVDWMLVDLVRDNIRNK